MTGKEFLNGITHSRRDIVEVLLDLLKKTDSRYCVIGGLAVNAYAEPVVSLDLDLVVVADHIESLRAAAEAEKMKVETFEHSVNLSAKDSDLRIQIQTDPRYQEFLTHAQQSNVLGHNMSVASLQDVLRGKTWAYSDDTRRKSKRQKDLADILRLVETHPELARELPPHIASILDEQ
jgi:hypothetical protein